MICFKWTLLLTKLIDVRGQYTDWKWNAQFLLVDAIVFNICSLEYEGLLTPSVYVCYTDRLKIVWPVCEQFVAKVLIVTKVLIINDEFFILYSQNLVGRLFFSVADSVFNKI